MVCNTNMGCNTNISRIPHHQSDTLQWRRTLASHQTLQPGTVAPLSRARSAPVARSLDKPITQRQLSDEVPRLFEASRRLERRTCLGCVTDSVLYLERRHRVQVSTRRGGAELGRRRLRADPFPTVHGAAVGDDLLPHGEHDCAFKRRRQVQIDTKLDVQQTQSVSQSVSQSVKSLHRCSILLMLLYRAREGLNRPEIVRNVPFELVAKLQVVHEAS